MQSFILSTVFAGLAAATAGPYAQCGGNGFTGETECESGYTCTVSSEWYSQCLPGAAATTATTTTAATSTTKAATSSTTSSASTPSSTSAAGTLKWLGINLSVAEFGSGVYPGRWGTEFYFPSEDAISVRIGIYSLFIAGFSRVITDSYGRWLQLIPCRFRYGASRG